jgi:hypothetical protein
MGARRLNIFQAGVTRPADAAAGSQNTRSASNAPQSRSEARAAAAAAS